MRHHLKRFKAKQNKLNLLPVETVKHEHDNRWKIEAKQNGNYFGERFIKHLQDMTETN